MPEIIWDAVGDRIFETGVDHGVLFVRNSQGAYPLGVAWNGLTTVTESPSGAEVTPQYADNMKYLNLQSAEEFAATIEAFTYPDEFAACDGTAEIVPGVSVGQQNRSTFGFSYRSKLGNDIVGQDYGYKIHLIYGALAAPTEKTNATINESPEASAFSWELSTTAVEVPGFKPSAHVVINSTTVPPEYLEAVEAILYGKGTGTPRLPLPVELIALEQTVGA
jgi:hypothetical protein